jgi:hypothetical protein
MCLSIEHGAPQIPQTIDSCAKSNYAGSFAKALPAKHLHTAIPPSCPIQKGRATNAQQIRPYVMPRKQPEHGLLCPFGLSDRTVRRSVSLMCHSRVSSRSPFRETSIVIWRNRHSALTPFRCGPRAWVGPSPLYQNGGSLTTGDALPKPRPWARSPESRIQFPLDFAADLLRSWPRQELSN